MEIHPAGFGGGGQGTVPEVICVGKRATQGGPHFGT
jgi:hypothetical protein